MHAISLKDHWTAAELEPGRVRYSRRFGAPRNADAETVWLVGTATAAGRMYVNGELISDSAAGRVGVAITGLLKPRHEVVIEAAAMPADMSMELR